MVAEEGDKKIYLYVAAMAQLRAGNLDKAQEWLEKHAASKGQPQNNQLTLSLLHAQRGDKEKAGEYLQLARKWLENKHAQAKARNGYQPSGASTWLEFNVLFLEAEAALKR